MARIRAIKPEFWSSPSVARLDPWARLLYIALWNWADDEGVGTANPRELVGFAFPNDDHIDVGVLRRLCADLSAHVGVIFYTVDERPFYCIPTWDKHQKIDKRRGGRYPKPDEADGFLYTPSDQRKRETSEQRADMSAQNIDMSAQRRRVVGTGTGEQGNRGTGEKVNYSREPADDDGTDVAPTSADADGQGGDGALDAEVVDEPTGAEIIALGIPEQFAPRRPAYDPQFEEFWRAYPARRKEKPNAYAEWKRAVRRATVGDVLDGAKRYAHAIAMTWEEAKYVPYPAKWLKRDGWTDVYGPETRAMSHAERAYRAREIEGRAAADAMTATGEHPPAIADDKPY